MQYSENQGRRYDVLTGDSAESKPATPKLRFLFGFRPLYFGNIGKTNNFSKYSDFFNDRDIWGGGDIPRNFDPLPPPPSGYAHAANER